MLGFLYKKLWILLWLAWVFMIIDSFLAIFYCIIISKISNNTWSREIVISNTNFMHSNIIKRILMENNNNNKRKNRITPYQSEGPPWTGQANNMYQILKNNIKKWNKCKNKINNSTNKEFEKVCKFKIKLNNQNYKHNRNWTKLYNRAYLLSNRENHRPNNHN